MRKERAVAGSSGNGGEKLRDVCATIRELGADLLGFKKLMDERDTRYKQSFMESKEAVTAALTAAKDQTNAAFLASEKAIIKAESAQNSYNAAHNDLTKKMDMQYAVMMPRTEIVGLLKALENKVDDGKANLAEHVSIDQTSHALAMPRLEVASLLKSFDGKVEDFDKKLADLRESRSKGEGKEQQRGAGVTEMQWLITTVIAAVAAFMALIAGVSSLFVFFNRTGIAN